MSMPTTVSCSQCGRSFPPKSQMNLATGGSIPMLVVPPQVDSVEAAIAQATCQVCLKQKGAPERGLYAILRTLGVKDAPTSTLTLPGRARGNISPRVDLATLVLPHRTPTAPSLTGVTIVVPTRQTGERQSGGRRTQGPNLPTSLRQPERAPHPPKIKPLKGGIGQDEANREALKAARVAIAQRDAAKKRARAEAFGKLDFWLTLTLARIRKNASTVEIWNLVEVFERKLGEAITLDPQQRDKNGLLAELGTSGEKLEALCHEFYLGKEPIRLRRPVEIVMIDAFEGGCRPEFWDAKVGKRPSFYELEVVRTKSSLPVPNSPLSGDDEPRPRIVYPEGSKYGSDYTVEHSRILAGIEGKIEQICGEVARECQRWFAIARDEIGTEMARVDIASHTPAFFQDLTQALAEEATELVSKKTPTDLVGLDQTITSPELPASV